MSTTVWLDWIRRMGIQTDQRVAMARAAWRVAPWAVLLLAILTSLYDLGRESLWIDEVSSVKIVTRAWPEFVKSVAGDPHPPLYYLVLRGWVAAFGTSETAARLPSALASILTVALVWRFLVRVADRRLALVTGLLLSVSGAFVSFAQEARPYAFLSCLSVLATSRLWAWRWGGRNRDLALYGLSAVALTYTHIGGWFVLAGHGVWWLTSRPKPTKAPLLLAIAVVIAYGPRWPALIGQAGWGCSYCLPPSLLSVVSVLYAALGSLPGLLIALGASGIATYAVFRGGARPVATAPGALRLLALTALMVHLVPLLISMRGSSIYLDRVTIGGLFALLALLATWILRLPRVLAWPTLAVIWVCQITGLVADYYVPDLRQDWRSAVAAVEARQPAGALAFVKPADFLVGAEFYGQPGYLTWRGLDDLGDLPHDRPTSLWVIWGERDMPDRAGLAAHLPACFSLGDVDAFSRLTVFEVRRNATCIQEPHAIP